jgi:hypothetical protein
MAEEYDRIQKRATEDPGTAGDQGEENWATLLRNWLQISVIPSHRFGDTQPVYEAIPLLERLTKIL